MKKLDVNNPILVSMSQWALGIHHIDNDMIFRFRIVSLELEDRPELNKSYSDRKMVLCNFCKTVQLYSMEPSFVSEFQNETVRFFISQPIPVYNPFYPSKTKRGKINRTVVSNHCKHL